MQLQKSFKSEYTDELKYKVRNRQNLADYALEAFPLENPQTMALRGIPHPEGLLEQLIPEQKADFQNAITLYEAYPTLTPLIASDESFWAYLTHVDLFPFVQKRWAGVKDKDVKESYIIDHWFFGPNSRFRNALATLWWNVYLTVDEDREDKYELTKILYKQVDIIISLTSSLLLYRHKEAVIGILDSFKEHPEILSQAITPRIRFIVKAFNRMGGVKILSYFDRNFFKSQIEKNLSTILSITNSSNIQEYHWID